MIFDGENMFFDKKALENGSMTSDILDVGPGEASDNMHLVADVNTTLVGFIRGEQECLEGAECRTELRELSTLLKFGLHVIQKIS